jgi:hypothetical protein
VSVQRQGGFAATPGRLSRGDPCYVDSKPGVTNLTICFSTERVRLAKAAAICLSVEAGVGRVGLKQHLRPLDLLA